LLVTCGDWYFFQDLESLISEHFGLTPAASQNSNITDNEELEEEEARGRDEEDEREVSEPNNDLQHRVERYLELYQPSDTESNSDEDEDYSRRCNEGGDADDTDAAKVRAFLQNGCGCKGNCNKKVSFDQVYGLILNLREMTKEEKEMFLIGVLTSEHETTQRGKKRKRSTCRYTFNGLKVCRKTFLLTHDIGRCALANIAKHVSKQGVTPRTHGNAGRKPKHALNFEDIQRDVQFITNYADEFGMPQPAAPRGRDDVPPIYLTCQTTKLYLHLKYTRSCLEGHHRVVKRTLFSDIWTTCIGHIKIATPRDDVCATCEKARKAVADSISEEEKLQNTTLLRDHILTAQKERGVYNDCIKLSKATNHQAPNTRYNHYTFDFSQNVSIPHHARQMGPVYFTSLRIIQIFGFRIDGTPKQVNFLIDEDETMGTDGSKAHGPDAVISMVDWAMDTYCDGETSCGIHCDNCPGKISI